MVRSTVFALLLLILPAAICSAAPAPAAPSPQATSQAKAPDDAEVQALQQERARTQERLESVDKGLTHLEAVSTVLLGVGTLIVAILLGTLFLFENRVDKATAELEKKANKAVADLDNTAKEVKQRFPMLASMEEQARKALKDVEDLFVAEDWLADRYAGLPIAERQRILTVEHLIALEFSGRSTAPQLRGMANFYFSKYKSEGLPSDLDRALYYALLAAERGNEGFQYLNDLGLVYTDLGERERQYQKKAIHSLKQSAVKQPAHQRCYYNLAVIYFPMALEEARAGRRAEADALFHEIQGLLLTALRQTKWELEVKPELTSLIHYNLACCLCRLTEPLPTAKTGRHALLDEACDHLETASRFKQTKKKTLYDDLMDPVNGDLFLLANNRVYRSRVEAIVAAFERSWAA